jgi:hypothetical protein
MRYGANGYRDPFPSNNNGITAVDVEFGARQKYGDGGQIECYGLQLLANALLTLPVVHSTVDGF